MKQYRRSRPEASRNGVRRSKALLEGEKESGTGRRVLNAQGGIPSHPLLRKIEIDKVKVMVGNETSTLKKEEREEMAKKKMSDLQKRQDFLRAMANFRPKETVFEAFATGGQKDFIYNSQVDKCASGSAQALAAMKNMRRQMKIARDKGSSLVIAGSKSAMELNGELADEEGIGGEEPNNFEQEGGPQPAAKVKSAPAGKRRLSKADRKKMKKNPNYVPGTTSEVASSQKAKAKRGADFRDDLNYMENEVTHDSAATARERQMEAAMQPSAASSSKGSTALAFRMEENMLDIVGDENVDLVKRQRMMRWDKSKRKYIQTTVGEELSGDSKSKKMRLESGQLVKSDKFKIGELYEKWQKKTNKSIGRVGVFDDVTEDAAAVDTTAFKKGQKGSGKKKSGGKNVDDEHKTAVAIRKEREQKEKVKLKNMKKGDRSRVERKQHSEKADAQNAGKRGQKSKKGPSGRWKGSDRK